ncbi:MAG: hypothetical protein IPN86_09215 [Saprospiraceae bacterium]|nr:hypothetical protein [Saprospiraceae bacterium]
MNIRILIFSLIIWLFACTKNDPALVQPCYGLPVETQLPVATYDLPLAGKFIREMQTFDKKLILITDVFGSVEEEIIIFDKNLKETATYTNAKKANSSYVLHQNKLFFNTLTTSGPVIKVIDLITNIMEEAHQIEISSSGNFIPSFSDLQVIDGALYYTFRDFDKFKIELYKWENAQPKKVSDIPFFNAKEIELFNNQNGQLSYALIHESNNNRLSFMVNAFEISQKPIYTIDVTPQYSLFNYKIGYNEEIYFYDENATKIFDITTGNILYESSTNVQPFNKEISYTNQSVLDPKSGAAKFSIAPYIFNVGTIPIQFSNMHFYMRIDQKTKLLNIETGCFEKEIILELGERIMYDRQSNLFYSFNGDIINEYSPN